jgi:hypothetical protein
LSGFALAVYKDVSFIYVQSSWLASYSTIFISRKFWNTALKLKLKLK